MPHELPSEKECRRLAERALGFATAEDASVSFVFEQASNTRFANNEITTSGAGDEITVVVTATKETQTGRVTMNETSDEALQRAMRRAEELAGFLPADPEYVGSLPPQKYLDIRAWDDATARTGAAERLPGVRAVVEPASKEKMNSSGFSTDSAVVRCVANKAGNFGWFRSTVATFSATVRTADGTGSGWAEQSAWRAKDMEFDAVAAKALRKARESAQPKMLEPGDYTVILEPAAVASFLGSVGFGLSARAAEEGRSFFAKTGGGTRLGEKLFHDSVTLRSDPTDPRRPGLPWGGGGFGGGGGGGGGGFGGGAEAALATQPIAWIERGVVTNLSYDRYWAKKSDREPTPPAGNLVLEGGEETLESLIGSTDRGVLVTNFWYIRSVNPQTLQATGLTRDGVWWIENGKIQHPVMNFRFNESPAVLLANVLGMTKAVRAGNMVAPAIKAGAFTFSSLSDAV